MPLNLDRAQYNGCFGYITTTALRLVQSNYDSTDQPFKACTRVFKITTGLPCVHTLSDARAEGISLLPSASHPHWHWDRYTGLAEPTLYVRVPICHGLIVLEGYPQHLRLQRLESDDVDSVGFLAIRGLVLGIWSISVG
jgi:hypothetical protein